MIWSGPRSVMFKTYEGKRVHPLDGCSSIGLEDGDRLFVYQCEQFVTAPTKGVDSVGADLSRLLFSAHLSDVTLEVGPERERICAHRCILASRSPKFEGLFSGQFSESSAAEVKVGVGFQSREMHTSALASAYAHFKLPTQEAPVFKLLLSYLYTNKVDMPSTTAAVLALLVMADEYLCGALKKLCEEELLQRLSLENVCDLYCAGTLHGLQELVDISKRLIVSNFHDLPDEGLELLKQKPDLLLDVARSGIRPRKRARTSR
ncbi:hypothetical protein KFL_001620220 [Klebsormidium nitens]|uniref:BTB domain-containing protein n=1 Tax=Klebsormidium nitens TaxID=105231 RepID=A0A1Y1I1G6_KLENI|nr:hypothetical protein KFL_001620220 [Klebsormidium nitens]|eukprot:GAQ83802.1 hypothetical protein KFL_001620220 [Klebsormidium nitens]